MITSKAWLAISLRSFETSAWTTPTTMSAPSSRACRAAAIPVSAVGRNFRSPGLDVSGVVSCATGTSATLRPAISFIITPPSPSTGEPSALVMLTAAQGYFDDFIFSKKFSGPKSNS